MIRLTLDESAAGERAEKIAAEIAKIENKLVGAALAWQKAKDVQDGLFATGYAESLTNHEIEHLLFHVSILAGLLLKHYDDDFCAECKKHLLE